MCERERKREPTSGKKNIREQRLNENRIRVSVLSVQRERDTERENSILTKQEKLKDQLNTTRERHNQGHIASR